MMLYETYYGVSYLGCDRLYHHGVKGQKWGVRRYQYPDGSLTEAGRLRYSTKSNQGSSGIKNSLALAVAKKYADRRVKDLGRKSVGHMYADSYIKTDVPLYRIQSNPKFESFAFFATYKKHDTDMYSGLFGKNLLARANAEAKAAERSGSDNAKELRDKANNMDIYQLELKNNGRLKLPSEDNAGHVVGKLLKDDGFKEDLKGSIADSAEKMRRPSQQLLFKEAGKLLDKDSGKLNSEDKRVIYKALNLSLINHNEQQVRMQNKFYGELKKQGYSALLDMNDRSFSSYHAKAPIIVFDVGNLKVSNVRKLSSDEINKKYKRYNTERLIKDIPEQIGGNLLRSVASNNRRAVDAREEALSRYLRQGDQAHNVYYGVERVNADRTLCIRHMAPNVNLSNEKLCTHK